VNRAVNGAARDATVLLELDRAVATVTLNRPEARNALNGAMIAELDEVFAQIAGLSEARVVLLTGAGSAFCAGVDLKEGDQSGVSPSAVLGGDRPPVTAALERCSKPVIAAVNGPCYGGGFELALASDLRVCSPTATFCLPEVRIGSLPGAGGTQRLVAAVPAAIAARILYTGEPIDAVTAQQYGLVSDLLGSGSFVEEAQALARRIAGNAPLSLMALKQALAAAHPLPGLGLERALWTVLAGTEDRAEGRAAFRNHREPGYKGR
jgi:E-phenylitaconyl-CoA hydratase